MTEEWRLVVSFPGYEVSNLGRVRSLPRTAIRRNGYPIPVKGRIRKTPLARRGYPSLWLKYNGKKILTGVHCLVAEAFIGPRPPGMDIAHRDSNKQNSVLSNLRYATRKDNETDKIANGTWPIGMKNGCAFFTDDQIIEIRRRVAGGEVQMRLAEEFGVGSGHISQIVRREIWRHI